jgi:thiol:disulfide interchange protein
MPCFLGCLALAMPRLVLVLVWLFSRLLQDNYSTILWPILGFVFMPVTTLAYAYAHQRSGGALSGVWIALVVVAVLVDLGLFRSSRSREKQRK